MDTESRKRVTPNNSTYHKGEAATITLGACLGVYASAAVEYFTTRGLDHWGTEARKGQLIMQ